MMFAVTIRSRGCMPTGAKDFIVELTSEEARKAVPSFYFILHDVEENRRQSELLIEGTPRSAANLVAMLRDNLDYHVSIGDVE